MYLPPHSWHSQRRFRLPQNPQATGAASQTIRDVRQDSRFRFTSSLAQGFIAVIREKKHHPCPFPLVHCSTMGGAPEDSIATANQRRGGGRSTTPTPLPVSIQTQNQNLRRRRRHRKACVTSPPNPAQPAPAELGFPFYRRFANGGWPVLFAADALVCLDQSRPRIASSSLGLLEEQPSLGVLECG